MSSVDWLWTREDVDDVDDLHWEYLPVEGAWAGEVPHDLPEEILGVVTSELDRLQCEYGGMQTGEMTVWVAASVGDEVVRRWEVGLYMELVPAFSTERVEVVP